MLVDQIVSSWNSVLQWLCQLAALSDVLNLRQLTADSSPLEASARWSDTPEKVPI